MKKFFILSLGALALMSACKQAPTDQYTINGETDLADGEVIRITYRVDRDSTFTDSVVVANGAFTLAGTVDKPYQAYIFSGESLYNTQGKLRSFIIEPGAMTIKLNGDDYSAAEITGSKYTAQQDSLNATQKPITEEMSAMGQQYQEIAGDTAALAAFMEKYDGLRNRYAQNNMDFILSHPDSYVSVVLLNGAQSDMSLDSLKTVFNGLTPEMQALAENTSKYISALESTQPGAVAPAITGTDINGKEFTTDSLRGKTVLVDFWATWCGPCRASLPHVKSIYDKYHDKGLEVVAVSLDRSEEPWREYINGQTDLGMTNYINIYDAPVGNADNYGIMYIPSKFIIDAQGKIVNRFDDEEALDAYLAETLGE